MAGLKTRNGGSKDPPYEFLRRSAQVFFILSEIRLRASGDILRLRRLRPGVPVVSAAVGGCGPDAGTAARVLFCSHACPQLIGLRRQRRQPIARLDDFPLDAAERPPISSADLISTSAGFLRGRPLAIPLREP
jgi:hypothetical protein